MKKWESEEIVKSFVISINFYAIDERMSFYLLEFEVIVTCEPLVKYKYLWI